MIEWHEWSKDDKPPCDMPVLLAQFRNTEDGWQLVLFCIGRLDNDLVFHTQIPPGQMFARSSRTRRLFWARFNLPEVTP